MLVLARRSGQFPFVGVGSWVLKGPPNCWSLGFVSILGSREVQGVKGFLLRILLLGRRLGTHHGGLGLRWKSNLGFVVMRRVCILEGREFGICGRWILEGRGMGRW